MKKSLFLIPACGSLLAGSCTAHHQTTRWEYRQAQNLAEVNQLAKQGWTVVNLAIPQSGPYEYLLRRPKP
jgi:hypothetical protein